MVKYWKLVNVTITPDWLAHLAMLHCKTLQKSCKINFSLIKFNTIELEINIGWTQAMLTDLSDPEFWDFVLGDEGLASLGIKWLTETLELSRQKEGNFNHNFNRKLAIKTDN